MKRFPEDSLDLGDRIFVRLLNPHWRNPYCKEYTSDQQKQIEVVKWIERYQNYIPDLEGLLCGVLHQTEVFQQLPIHEPPLHPIGQFSANECLRRLALQSAALQRLVAEDRGLISGEDGVVEELRAKLRKATSTLGVKECAAATGLDRETLTGFVSGRTKKPQRKTVEKLVKFLNSL